MFAHVYLTPDKTSRLQDATTLKAWPLLSPLGADEIYAIIKHRVTKQNPKTTKLQNYKTTKRNASSM